MIVTNQSTSPAFGVILRDALPVEMAFVSATPSQGSCDVLPTSDAGAIVQCRMGDMEAGASATVTVVTQSLGSGTLVNLATVTSKQQETNNENNGATATAVVTEPPTPVVPSGAAGRPRHHQDRQAGAPWRARAAPGKNEPGARLHLHRDEPWTGHRDGRHVHRPPRPGPDLHLGPSESGRPLLGYQFRERVLQSRDYRGRRHRDRRGRRKPGLDRHPIQWRVRVGGRAGPKQQEQ